MHVDRPACCAGAPPTQRRPPDLLRRFRSAASRVQPLEGWRGCKVTHDTFERSNLFWHWSGGTRFVLRRCRRSDQAHFDFIRSLQALEPAKALEAAKARYPSRGKRAADWNLTLSNHKRRRINSEMQHEAAVATEDRVWIDGETPFWCFAGTRLIGCNCTLRGIVNGAFCSLQGSLRKPFGSKTRTLARSSR